MADTVIAGSLTLDGTQASRSVKDFKRELREANVDLIQMQQQFGELSPEALTAAKNVAMLRDQIQDAKEVSDLFDPGARFQAFGNVLRTVAGGFSALTGAAALFGDESEELQKTLLKVQAALAITEGVNTIVDSAKDFQRLKAVAIDAFQGIRGAMLASGIGAFVVILGTIVAYWDEIKAAVSGVTKEQQDLLDTTTKTAEVESERLKHISDQDNILKLQGKTEREILNIKIKQVDATIAAGEAQLEAQKDVIRAQTLAEARNKEIAKGIITFLNLPLTLILSTVDKVRQALGQTSNLAGNLNDYLASFVFDPKKVKEEGDATIKELESQLTTLRNQRAGFVLSIQEIDKQAAIKRKEEAEKRQQEHESELQRRYEADKMYFSRAFELELSEANKRKELRDKQNREFQDTIAKNQKSISDLYAVSREITISQLDEAGQQSAARMEALDKEYAEKYELVKGNAQAEAQLTAYYERQKTAISEAATMQRLSLISGFLGQATQIFGQQTAAGKAFAIAQATIDTYTSAVAAYKSVVGIPIIGPGLAVAAAAAAVAAGLANVRKIISVKVPGTASGGSTPSISASTDAPLQATPRVQSTLLPQEQINQIGNAAAPVKAYVVESEMTDKQERIKRLSKAAQLGQ